MPAYRFAWDAFDDNLLPPLAACWGYQGAKTEAREWLRKSVKRPTPEFVRAAKDVLVKHWLPAYPGAKHIVERLIDAGIGPMRQPRSQKGYVRYIGACRNSKTLRAHLLESLLRFGDNDRNEDEHSFAFVPRFAILDPKSQPADPRKPHAYQREVWEKLDLLDARSQSEGQGLVVMPTGSGKTYTAVHWLMNRVISRGGRVLWLAHRHELLVQAGAEFHRLAGLATTHERLRVRIVSGVHCSTTQIDPADHIVVASVHSLARNKPVTHRLLSDPRLFVVVDEAHHAPAKSYRDMIERLQAQKTTRLLGLTATPTRTVDEERPVLSRLFGGHIVAQVEMYRLIEQGVLARPIPVTVTTDAEVEAGVTQEDRDHYGRFNELSEEWLDRIATLANRNAVIVSHLVQAKEKYGQVLIFAINVRHAVLLAEDLRRQGMRADYVASYRPDGSEGDPARVLDDFRQGRLDVLVNVQMVTEGVDLPAVKTVFLTRPTSSEILIRQMIGRALRGPAAGGSDQAYLVSFLDHWEQFQEWDNPFDLVPDIEALAGVEDRGEEGPEREVELYEAFYEHLPWPVISSVAHAMRQQGLEYKADAFEAVPDGWIILERVEEDESISIPIAIYAHQRPCWEALIRALKAPEQAPARDRLYDEYFADCDSPKPSIHQIYRVVEHLERGGEAPEFHPLEGRERCDPRTVAETIRERDLGYRAQVALITESYTTLARAVYPHLREYQAAVQDVLYEFEHPEESTYESRAVPIFEPRSDEQLAPGPAHDLEALMREVLVDGSDLLNEAALPFDGELGWSNRILKGWYGKAFWDEVPIRIRINVLLDSPDVSAETMKFLLWHEYLHLYLRQGHTQTFRALENRWLGAVEANRELDTLNERFGIQYW